MRIRRADYRQVKATPEEVATYFARRGRYGEETTPAVPRAECIGCGTRIWYSGLGIGAHDRGCTSKPTRGELAQLRGRPSHVELVALRAQTG